ncbi:hypothetical protein GCK72_016893 [Caenorhabditis remanei]|uniref:Uncharacterized protein n=1 Tax=Caenorhabditis remanei TaxID=31234 RepID=A0A6A5G6Z8_CAERE|nr:hypothetical protein GCK72_016893 [Caenorhabditis remanei]KAF1750344.1 hypothetical protein GCK72_016893 [Caenorhabditis remanei]
MSFIKQEIGEDVSSVKKWCVKQEVVEEASESQPDSKKGLSIVSNQKSNKNTAPRRQTSVLMSLLLGDDDNVPLPYKSKQKEPKFKAPRVKKEPKEPRAPHKPRNLAPRNPKPSCNENLMRFHQEEYLKNVYWQEYCRYMDTNWHSNYDVMRKYYGMPPVVIPETAHPSWRQSISPMTGYCSSDSSSSF